MTVGDELQRRTFGDYDDSHLVDGFDDDGIGSDCDEMGGDDELCDENDEMDDAMDHWPQK